MTDALDTQIRILVTELMNTAPQAPSLPEIEWRETRGAEDAERPSSRSDHGRRPDPRRRHVGLAAALAVAATVVILAGLLVFSSGGGTGGGGGGAPKAPPTAVGPQTGTWRLADDVLSGTWQQNTTGGPPRGVLSCPGPSTCYAMSGHYDSPDAGAPLLSESLYVSTDAGVTWSAFQLPQGFAPTSPLACGGTSVCAAGGTDNGHSVLVTTTDGGHSFAVANLPANVGHLDTLSCPSATFCAGLAASSEYLQIGTTSATFLSTSDGGKSFSDAPIVAGNSMDSLTCSSSRQCTAVGWSNRQGPNDLTAGVAARTTDGGRTWQSGTLPVGFGISYLSPLSCADALHCSVAGLIGITVKNPPQCASLPQHGATGTATPVGAQSPAVRAIAQAESEIATAAALKAAASPNAGFSCNGDGQTLVSDIASTTDGGASWTPDPLPAGVPQPMLDGLSCPTDTQCWASGSDAVPRQVGTSDNGGSPVLLGTNDGGSTWSPVTFSVPSGASNFLSQAYLSMGWIDCPAAGDCVALGAGAQGSPSVPTYSLVVPGSS
jgi:hypothetical protein